MPELVVQLKDRELKRYPIYGVSTTVGRDPTCDLVLDNMGVSRQHFGVVMDGEHFYVEDASSANGVYVNGVPTRKQRLYDGDTIQVGKFSVVFRARGGADVEKLKRNALLPSEPEAAQAVLDPEATMALAPADIAKFISGTGYVPGGSDAPPTRRAAPQHAAPAQRTGYGADHQAQQSPHARAGQAAQQRVRGEIKERVRTSPRSGRVVSTQLGARAANVAHAHEQYEDPYRQQAPQHQPHVRPAHNPATERARPGVPPASPIPVRYTDEVPSRMGTVFGNTNQSAYLEQQAATFRNLAIVLGVAVVSLMGLTLALVLLG